MTLLKTMVYTLILWYLMTAALGFLWGLLQLPYMPTLSGVLNWVLMPVAFAVALAIASGSNRSREYEH